jgi:peptidoglycan/LPS O-acetylase OafA/YrhL
MGRQDRIISLELLRGVAAFAVMVPHFFMYYLKDASTGAEIISITAVEVFFVLSGFVLGPQIVLCAKRRSWVSLRTFFLRRWMRTIPSYLIALLAISVIFREIASADFFRYATYVQNLFSQHNTRDYYPVAWSLSVEEWFYVTFPPFVLLWMRLTKGTGEWQEYFSAVLVFILAITIIRSIYGDTSDWGAQVRRVVVFRIDSIAYGFLLYLLLQRIEFDWNGRHRHIAFLVFAATAALLLYINHEMLESGAKWLREINPFVSAAFGMSTVVFFLSLNSFLQGQWAHAVSLYFGRISYPVYLFHLVVLYAMSRLPLQQAPSLQFFMYVMAVLLLTTIFFYGVEKPILASRPRYP